MRRLLVVFAALTAAKAFFQPGLPPATLFVRVLFLWAFVAALIIAALARKEQKASLPA